MTELQDKKDALESRIRGRATEILTAMTYQFEADIQGTDPHSSLVQQQIRAAFMAIAQSIVAVQAVTTIGQLDGIDFQTPLRDLHILDADPNGGPPPGGI